MTSIRSWIVATLCAAALIGCGDDDERRGTDGGPGEDAGGGVDSGGGDDGGPPPVDGGLDCVDDDGDGFGDGADCAGADCDDTNPDVNPAATEACNGADDDCDGAPDNGFAGLGDPCTAGVGACEVSGSNVCSADGSGVECDAVAVTPAIETCNGLDDDCDGTPDNGFAGLGDACSSGIGACAASGTNVCTPDGTGIECNAVAGTPAAETCNALDDDCNGTPDDALGSTSCGTGICAATVENCVGGVTQTCSPGAPSAETCNALDDDCNGTPDDGLGSTSCGMGACSQTVENCAGGVTQICMPGAPSAETCNAVDDDCNGLPDDGLGTLSCGIGSCARMTAACIGGVTQTCVPGAPTAETCDGADDDCNGVVDDGLGTLSCGVGVCRRTVPACAGGVAGMCVAGAPTGTDACPANGMDEDCDGVNDDACPTNDAFASATTIALGAAETSVTGTTAGAARDGMTVPCGCTAAGNVWYRFTLATESVVYFDTSGAGTTYDTSLWITDAAGTPVPGQAASGFAGAGLCNDDSGCGTTGGFTSNLQTRTGGVLAAGTYHVSVSGCSTGAFVLRGQAIPTNTASTFFTTRLTGTGTVGTALTGPSVTGGTCGGAASGEHARWFMTCGGQMEFFSLCASDGGTFSRRIGATNYDPAMYIRSGATGAQVSCNDDGGSMGGTNCVGTGVGADLAQYGSRLNNIVVGRGIGTIFVDERVGGPGMTYTMAYVVR